MSQGSNANKNGARLEQRVELMLSAESFNYVKQHRYEGIYGNTSRMDFYIEDLDLAIECKNQEGAGSVAEKLPYVMYSFEQHPAKNGLLILGGAYWKTKPGIKTWAKMHTNKSDKNIQVIYEDELGDWLEQTENRRTIK